MGEEVDALSGADGTQSMTSLMEEAIEALRHVPDDRQNEIARLVMQFAGIDQPVYRLSPEERADILEAKAEIERGEFATDDEVHAIWAKHSPKS